MASGVGGRTWLRDLRRRTHSDRYDPETDPLLCALRAQTERTNRQTARLRLLYGSERLPSWEELLSVYEDEPESEA